MFPLLMVWVDIVHLPDMRHIWDNYPYCLERKMFHNRGRFQVYTSLPMAAGVAVEKPGAVLMVVLVLRNVFPSRGGSKIP